MIVFPWWAWTILGFVVFLEVSLFLFWEEPMMKPPAEPVEREEKDAG